MPPPQPARGGDRPDFGAAALVRIFQLHQRLCRGVMVTANALAQDLGVAGRTVQRDIALMRDQLGAPVEWDAAGGTYFYTRTCDLLPLVRLGPGEAFALAVAAHAFAAGDGAPLGSELVAAVAKLTPLIGGVVSFPLAALGTVLSAPPAPAGEFRHAELLVHATLHRRVLRLVYKKPAAAPEVRTVHPLHLAAPAHRWMLIAHDPATGLIKHFLLARIREAQATGRTFIRPATFDAAAYLRGSLGRFGGGADIEVRIAFSARVADYARENFRHPSHHFSGLPGGRTLLTLRLNNLIDIKNTVLAYAEHAEVLAPATFRAEVRASLRATLAQYAD